jgi:hypothetical protein
MGAAVGRRRRRRPIALPSSPVTVCRISTRAPFASVPTTLKFGAVRTLSGVPVGSATRQSGPARA